MLNNVEKTAAGMVLSELNPSQVLNKLRYM